MRRSARWARLDRWHGGGALAALAGHFARAGTEAQPSPRRAVLTLSPMTAFKARVREGRLVLDEPTTLPEGTELPPIVELGELPDEREREELRHALDKALEEARTGQTLTTEEVLREMERAERAALSSR